MPRQQQDWIRWKVSICKMEKKSKCHLESASIRSTMGKCIHSSCHGLGCTLPTGDRFHAMPVDVTTCKECTKSHHIHNIEIRQIITRRLVSAVTYICPNSCAKCDPSNQQRRSILRMKFRWQIRLLSHSHLTGTLTYCWETKKKSS